MDGPGFIFGGTTGETAQSLARRRAIAERMLAGSGAAPRNVGEGIARIGEALAGSYLSRKVSEREKEGRAEAGRVFGELFTGGAPVAMPPASTPPILPESQAPQSGWNEDMVQAVTNQESGGNPDAVSPKGATGLMQVMPETARDPGFGVPTIFEMARQSGIPVPDESDETLRALLRDPELNKAFGTAYGSAMASRYPDQPDLQLAAYNAGPGAVDQYGGLPPYPETQGYVQSVQGALGGGQAPQAPAQAQPAPSQGPDMQRVAQIAAALENGFLSDGQKRVAEALLQQELQKGSGEMTPYQREQLRLREEEMRLRSSEMTPYQRGQLRLREEEMRLREEEMQLRSSEMTPYQREQLRLREEEMQLRSSEMTPYQSEQLRLREEEMRLRSSGKWGDGTTVNLNQPEANRYVYGTAAGLPAGYRFDTVTGTAEAIPGGPAAVEAAKVDAAQSNAEEGKQNKAAFQVTEIKRAKDMIKGSPRWTTGLFGQVLKDWGGTDAKDLSGLLQSVQANIGFAELQKMRESSPTGGALGQVTEKELAFLQSVAGNLDQSQSAEQLLENLSRLELEYGRVVHGPDWTPPPSPPVKIGDYEIEEIE
jgi:hypothetical protein